MSEELKIIQNEDGTFSEYDDTFDLIIHCQSEEEQNEVLAKLNADSIDWITEENPEEENVYLVTWRGKLWTDSYMGLCEWDGERWLMEDFEPYRKYKGEDIIITAWSDIEPYKDR